VLNGPAALPRRNYQAWTTLNVVTKKYILKPSENRATVIRPTLLTHGKLIFPFGIFILPHLQSSNYRQKESCWWFIIPMGWDYVSELLPPMGLLFFPKLIYEYRDHGGMISTGKLLIRLPELFGKPINSHLVANQEELAKEFMNFALRSIVFTPRRVL
jgi:hypothetical protein